MTIDEKAARTRLIARKEELADLSTLSEGSRATVELDQQSVGRLSRMDAMQMQAMAQASERQRQLEIRKIDAALLRLDEGDYGYCVTCGDEISNGRLEIDPAAPTCIGCAN